MHIRTNVPPIRIDAAGCGSKSNHNSSCIRNLYSGFILFFNLFLQVIHIFQKNPALPPLPLHSGWQVNAAAESRSGWREIPQYPMSAFRAS